MRISDWSSDVCSSDLLPPNLSTSHKAFSEDLRTEISNLSYVEDEYRVFGGKSEEGAMIVSQTDAPVDFNKMHCCRVANIVPNDDVEIALRSVSAFTQTLGTYSWDEHTSNLETLMRITYALF